MNSDKEQITRTISLPLTVDGELALAELVTHFQLKHQTVKIEEAGVVNSALIGMAEVIRATPEADIPGDLPGADASPGHGGQLH